MMRKIFLMLYCVCFVSLVTAAPPFQISNQEGSLLFSYPQFFYYPINHDIDFYWHVYNSTAHIQSNQSITCIFDLMDESGITIINDTKANYNPGSNHFFRIIPKEYLHTDNKYNYYVRCNSTEAGFFDGNFQVTSSGFELQNDMFPIIVSFGMIVIFFFVLGFLNKMFKLKILSFGIGLIEIIMAFSVLYAKEIGKDISGIMMVNFYSLIFIGFGVAMIGLIMFSLNTVNMEDRIDGKKWDKKEKWE